MSYDINNYAMLAISLPDFLETLKKDISVPLETYRDFVLIDKKIDGLLIDLPESFKDSEFATSSKIADEGFTECTDNWRFDGKGPKGTFIASLLAATGISEPIFFDSEKCNLVSFQLTHNIEILPKILIKHLSSENKLKCETLASLKKDRLNDVLSAVANCLYNLGKINLVKGSVEDENGNDKFTFTIPCIKSAIEDLYFLYKEELKQNSDSYNSKIDSIHFWMQYVINMYVGSLGYDEELEVVSTNKGFVHNSGGMLSNIPYISIGGLESYDEDGWSNPRDGDSDYVRDLERAIVQDSGKEFAVFTPQFGG